MREVILKQDIYKLGDRGDVVRVAHGYARNYLIPQGLAIPADKAGLRQVQAMRAAGARDAVRLRGDAEKQFEALDGVVIRVVARASLNDQLYGSVTTRDIAAELAKQGLELDRRRIDLTQPIRTLGDYEIPVHIYKGLSTGIKVEVRALGREDEPLGGTRRLTAEFEFAPPDPEEDEEEFEEGYEPEEGSEAAHAADGEDRADGEEAAVGEDGAQLAETPEFPAEADSEEYWVGDG